jgi:hypothetical protein
VAPLYIYSRAAPCSQPKASIYPLFFTFDTLEKT